LKSYKKIFHIVPINRLGGVEVAAQSLDGKTHNNNKLKVEYIFKESDLRSNYSIFNPSFAIKLAYMVSKEEPDLVIVSLWRSCVTGLFIKLFRPRTKIVLFIHSIAESHFLDFILTRIMLFFSVAVWSDSKASLEQRFKFLNINNKSQVISYFPRVLKKIDSIKVQPNFIFWGRIGVEKGLDRALIIFSKIAKYYKDASFTIIGPDGGQLMQTKKVAKQFGVSNLVNFYDALDINEIYELAKEATFYIQTSKFEGMALSVVEAMQMGLVPVVTPVGEIASYCNEDNAVIVYSNNEVVRNIIYILESDDEFFEISNKASSTWEKVTSYEESFFNECRKTINKYE
jgi:glycosyltransferase involved in cell wall biosynthesis